MDSLYVDESVEFITKPTRQVRSNILFQTFLRVMPFSPLTASAVFFIFTSFFLLVLFKFFFRRLVSALTAGWLMKLVTRIRTECDYVAGPQLAP